MTQGLAAAAGGLLLAVASAAPVGPNVGGAPWLDPTMPVPQRVAALLPKLSVDEKIKLTYATHTGEATVKGFNVSVGAVKFMSAFSCPRNITACITARNELQAHFMSTSPHGIPLSFINEGLHGGAPGGTIFPMPITQASAWNVSLISQVASVIASEASAIGVDTVFAPVVNMMTDPRFGRLQEGFGENPVIASHMGKASVLALQGGPGNSSGYLPLQSVNSLGKHFAAYGAAQGGLNGGAADVSNRTLHEVYLRPWMALGSAGVRCAMASHNTVADVPAHANGPLLDELRNSFGFGTGVVLSDCDDIGAIQDFRMASDGTHAAALALAAGVDWDLQCGTDPEKWSYNKLPEALAAGLVSEADLDRSAARVLTQKFATQLFDGRATVPTDRVGILDSPQHRAIAYQAAAQGIVMLQNTHSALPMPDLAKRKVALFGPIAKDESSMIGSYSLAGAEVITVDKALDKAGVQYQYMEGCHGSGPPGSGCNLATAISLAEASDMSLLVLGDGQGQCGEWGDRDSLDLAGGQLQLLEAVANVSKTTIVVLIHGRPQTFGLGNSILSQVDALFAGWRPGEEGGTAIVDLLMGHQVPSGKLVQSWPRTVGHVHSGSSPWLQRVQGKWVANSKGCETEDGRCYDPYVFDGFDSTPLFQFGFGMSYTTFRYTKISITKPSLGPGRVPLQSLDEVVFTVTVDLKNSGTQYSGQEVVQVCTGPPKWTVCSILAQADWICQDRRSGPWVCSLLGDSHPVVGLRCVRQLYQPEHVPRYIHHICWGCCRHNEPADDSDHLKL